MTWCIVEFNPHKFKVVPSFWFDSKTNLCAWPKKSCKFYITAKIPPYKTAFFYLAARKIGKDIKNYEKACQIIKKSQEIYFSSSDESEENSIYYRKTTSRPGKKRNISELSLWCSPPSYISSMASSNDDNISDTCPATSSSYLESPKMTKRTKVENKKNEVMPNYYEDFLNDKQFSDQFCTSTPQKMVIAKINEETLVPTAQSNVPLHNIIVPKISQNLSSSEFETIIDLLNKNQENTLNALKKFESSVNEKMEKCDKKLNTIITLIDESNGIHSQKNQFQNIISSLPLVTEEDLNTFEQNLSSVYNFKKQMMSDLKQKVHNNMRNSVRVIIQFLFDDSLLKEYNFKGKRNKKNFSSLKICSCIFDIFKKHNHKDIERAIQHILSVAKSRSNTTYQKDKK